MSKQKVVLIVINVDWLFLLHRLAIATALKKEGWRVIVAAKNTGKGEEIEKKGFEYIDINISRSGTNLIKEFVAFFNLFFIYKKLQPDVVYQITMKPVIYGSLISRILNIATINAISGLGYNFTDQRKSLVQTLMTKMMSLGFNKRNNSLIFENPEDCSELKKIGIIKKHNRVTIIKGIGVNLEEFKPLKNTELEKVIILLPTRMLWDKGVKEFIEAAILLKEEYINKASFILCGRLDYQNKQGVPKEYLIKNQFKGYLEWLGNQTDMVTQYQRADVVVLPSYREGLPVVLMEACAMGKPIVTTNAIGCKDCVDDGENGYKVNVKSIQELAKAIRYLIDNPKEREKMGKASRLKAEKEFDRKFVIEKHLKLFHEFI
ncbi:glycosyltransferase involved in cell wall biosynthesis [Wenyingzhuangia heitensis]|uniref:Glycosyltransferase involved in cell wall biosynthesis n=1 Tax=Wenyingzhuangia heitensis TaxID=1487859 RepID=A0ABX0U6A4_9FLAO|nr:glycosyltransferase family 4 protein [Wenyingzhuangia heitensis]NIJ44322.1 glycosyltransferase involved in cell wall biosynthesis [Wenyingzhuangia heitensis]